MPASSYPETFLGEREWQVADERKSVLLPLFSMKSGVKYVPERSGLNQWNAAGRERDPDEVYVSVPRGVHKQHPGFFPDRNTIFDLLLPDGTQLQAKICQENDKALMTNPNRALGEWLLRKVLGLKRGELLRYDKLLRAGFDSLRITHLGPLRYQVNVATEHYGDDEAPDEP